MAEETPPVQADKSGWQTLIDTLRAWPLSRKIALGAVTAGAAILFAVIILQARTADYQLLYGNLAKSDAAAMVEWLKGQNIPYRLNNNGRNILIPSSGVHEARLSLASAGLPQGGGVGFEIFDKQSFALTDFVQKVNYSRALQGELARTIASLGPVETARVHLVLPEKRLFKNQQKPATASVIIKLAPGRRLAESQVEGITHLVAGSIEGLSQDDVTIIDQNGNVLTQTGDRNMIGNLSPDMLQFQLQVEQHLEERAQALLDKALGSKNAMVRVTAALDFAHTEKTEELFDPEEPVIRSEQLSEEKSGSEIVGGVPGVQSNLQGNTNPMAGASPPSSRSQKTTNYEISKVVSKTVNPVGTIKRISVAVLVADKLLPASGEQEERSEPRSEEELLALEKMISSALGLDKTRGDKIEVTSMPFSEAPLLPGDEGLTASALNQYMPIIRYGLLLLGGLLVYFLMVRPVIKILRGETTQHFKTVEELEAEEAEKSKVAVEQEREELMLKDPIMRIRKNVDANPVFSAHILKSWIKES
ncbi:flagellar basal-body MS-ring/collar protein FliF [Desulfogranum mediterraneum]|uniref:flagellar basal-body MS-ring/collar protein FliF n=1 Tax=Desulfogranum mediterraneum TaxID=160661 RepID=UPI000406C501|nr:flagellar basal-body MS-ring/collar protein FliF [Desulfogranum mediterraneum]